MKNIVEDLAILTNIPEYILKRIVSIANYSISHSVYEHVCENKNEVSIDIGIGKLKLYIGTDTIRYKFIPSDCLETQLINMLSTNTSPLANSLENSLKEKVEKSYKELL